MKNTLLAAARVAAQPLGKTLTRIRELAAEGMVDSAATDQLERVAARFSVAITPQMAELIDPQDPADPIARQFVPRVEELADNEADRSDPIGDHTHSPVPGIVHRYPDRLLLMPVRVCPVYCRFCFRREDVGNNGALLSDTELDAALDYIRTHTEIWEVILSGGDPLLLAPRRLATIIAALEAMPHVKIIRIHTRVPVVAPERITVNLVDALNSDRAVYVVLHTNHPRELTKDAQDACAMLVDKGIPMLSQTVLLRGINDDPDTMEKLLRQLVEHRIKPYYLHHADRAPGTGHFRTTIAAGRELVAGLRGRLSGLCQPEYVLDIPGGAGKVPIAGDWIEPSDSHYQVRDYRGGLNQYTDTDGDCRVKSSDLK